MSQETIRLNPGSDSHVSIPGKFFAVLSATAPFLVEFDRGGRQLVTQGSKLSFQNFKRIVFTENSGVLNTIVFFVGDQQYDGVIPTQNGAVPITSNEDVGDVYPYLMSPDGSALTVLKSPPKLLPETIIIDGVSRTRKAFHIANMNGSPLEIHLQTGELVDVVPEANNRAFSLPGDISINGKDGSTIIALYYTLDPL